MSILTTQNAYDASLDTRSLGRMFLIAQSRAMGHFDNGDVALGEALAWELDEFRSVLDSMSAEDVRSILEDAVEWSQYCVDLARRAALDEASTA